MSAVSEILLFSVSIGFSFWCLKYLVSYYVFKGKKEELNKLNARISILKLHLRGKIKRKINKIETALRKDSDILSLCRPRLEALSALEFMHASDYQSFINNLYEITLMVSEHVRSKHKNLLRSEILAEAPAADTLSAQDENLEKCRKLVKYDKAHMTIIVDIIKTTDELSRKIDEYNVLAEYEHGQKKIEDKPERISVEHFEILQSLVEQARLGEIDVPDFPVLEQNLFDDAG